LLSAVQTTRGADPVVLRVLRNDGAGAELVLEEEQSADWETDHIGEDVGYLVMRPGPIR
jgi:hypothetical protein